MSDLAPWQRQALAGACSALEDGRLGHALLFQGDAGMGKARVATALARRLLCRDGALDQACGRCLACQRFDAGTHGDFRRVGLEPNDRGDKLRSEILVEQVRALGEWLALTPQLGGAQVAIIDPADALNPAAGNALLKTLEEPAGNRYLLLVASRPGRLPATIRSRCQRVEFRMPSPAEAEAWLRALGHGRDRARIALAAAQGHPGLAADWLAHGGLQLRQELAGELDALANDRLGPIEVAQRWLADEHAALRLRFAAELALLSARKSLGLSAVEDAGLTGSGDFHKLSAWFDAVNRLREQLGAPLRHDLLLAGLLREWRTMKA